MTVGASFGTTRELSFLHEPSGQSFTFPQANGDVFAFDSDVNAKFQHGGGREAPICQEEKDPLAWQTML